MHIFIYMCISIDQPFLPRGCDEDLVLEARQTWGSLAMGVIRGLFLAQDLKATSRQTPPMYVALCRITSGSSPTMPFSFLAKQIKICTV